VLWEDPVPVADVPIHRPIVVRFKYLVWSRDDVVDHHSGLSPQKSAAFCDVRHVTRRGYVGLSKTPEAAPIHLAGPMRLGLARARGAEIDSQSPGDMIATNPSREVSPWK
jgi:hypothetical protein